MIAFIDDHRCVHGVGPICRVLGIAPSTFYAFKAVERDPDLASDRARQDRLDMVVIKEAYVAFVIRPIALNRKNALFAGHDAEAQNWAMIASLIETCKLNAVDPHARLTNTLKAIVNGHKQSNIDDLLPSNYVK